MSQSASPDKIPAGTMLGGRYELIEDCGAGGMSTVYKATDTNLGRTVAVKVMAPWLGSDQAFARRFIDEARAAARLNHPGIATVHDAVEDGERRFIVMEYVDGLSLDKLPQPETGMAVDVAIQVAEALSYAHQNNVIHCDVKPGNILVEASGRVRLVDFGIARAATQTWALATTVLGTAAYMAPETIDGMRPEAPSDVYSLALTLYEMLAGRLPFSGESPAALTAQRLVKDPLPLSESAPDIQPMLAEIVMSALGRDPDKRTQSAQEFGAQLVAAVASGATEGPIGSVAGLEPLGASETALIETANPGDGPAAGAAAAPFSAHTTPDALERDDTAAFAPASEVPNRRPASAFPAPERVSPRSAAPGQRTEMKIPGWLLVIPALIALFLIAFFVTRAVLADDDDDGGAGSNAADFPGDLQQAFDNFESRRAQAQAEIGGDAEPSSPSAGLAAYLDYLRRFRSDTQELAQSLLLLEPPTDLAGVRDGYVNASAETVEAIGQFVNRAEDGDLDPARLNDALSRQRDACFALQSAARELGNELDLGCGELSPDTVATLAPRTRRGL